MRKLIKNVRDDHSERERNSKKDQRVEKRIIENEKDEKLAEKRNVFREIMGTVKPRKSTSELKESKMKEKLRNTNLRKERIESRKKMVEKKKVLF